jgi:hypothetical protein
VGRTDKPGGLQVYGRIRAADVSTLGADVAERFVGRDLVPGDVVRLAGAGRRVERSRSDSDPAVIGVVSTSPGLLLGQDLGHVAVALSGTVPCRVDATKHPIRVGDLLVSAERPGCARAFLGDSPPVGALLGKALAELAHGLGTIPILVR